MDQHPKNHTLGSLLPEPFV